MGQNLRNPSCLILSHTHFAGTPTVWLLFLTSPLLRKREKDIEGSPFAGAQYGMTVLGVWMFLFWGDSVSHIEPGSTCYFHACAFQNMCCFPLLVLTGRGFTAGQYVLICSPGAEQKHGSVGFRFPTTLRLEKATPLPPHMVVVGKHFTFLLMVFQWLKSNHLTAKKIKFFCSPNKTSTKRPQNTHRRATGARARSAKRGWATTGQRRPRSSWSFWPSGSCWAQRSC